ncbi:MAG: Smr/MutS family protein [Sorangiineae bacterium]|nr:Smr/MutS family protein [Polyangiaceae bacterium]MEB2324113.1 Smr/MutS family protein [Sorangiineae bacterium]
MTGPRRAKTALDLEWALLLDRVAGAAAGEVAAARLRALAPASEPGDARARMARLRELLERRAQGHALPVRAVDDPRELIARARRGALATGPELTRLITVLALARELRAFARGERARESTLAPVLDSAPALDALLERLRRDLDDEGRVADRASPALAEARRRVAELRRNLSQRASALAQRHSEVLQGAYYAEREGRTVLPVRADAHRRVPGIVLGSSASGGTLYVEPEELIELGNRLRVEEAAVEREEARVLAELTALVAARAEDLAVAAEACITADLLSAIARFAEDARALPLAPDDGRGAELRGMRHPLLVATGVEVVPSDLLLEGGQALVISGPNAGGKTVALKSLGLAAWMARAGLPIPAEPGSRIGWLEPVLTDIGDSQSLSRSLSTFSAHVENLASILEASGEHALVLLDEVAAGTDPEEGSALAAAVLEALVTRGAAVAVTTHYERLKELSAGSARFVNASVGFDVERMLPTFRLSVGAPGASSALAVARRFGIPEPLIERARALLPERSVEREELVRHLEAERQALETARRTLEADALRQRELVAELEAERARARADEERRLARDAEALTAEVRHARAIVRSVLERTRHAGATRAELERAERELDAAAHPVAVGSPLARASKPRASASNPLPVSADALAVGARVFVARLGLAAEVLEPPARGRVRVQAGALTLIVRVDELEREGGVVGAARNPSKRLAREEKPSLALAGRHVPARTRDNSLDLRGQRVDEALDELDRFIDRMLREGEPAGFVLHGHGTGAVKHAVREHLGTSALLARWEPAGRDDGGDAWTVFWVE